MQPRIQFAFWAVNAVIHYLSSSPCQSFSAGPFPSPSSPQSRNCHRLVPDVAFGLVEPLENLIRLSHFFGLSKSILMSPLSLSEAIALHGLVSSANLQKAQFFQSHFLCYWWRYWVELVTLWAPEGLSSLLFSTRVWSHWLFELSFVDSSHAVIHPVPHPCN